MTTMEAVKSITFPDGASLTIHYDESPESPRKWDNLGTMVCFHRNYALGDEHDYRHGDYSGWDELRAQIEKDHDPALILPLYMYDHSGVTISTKPFSCPWDSGQVGFIFVSKSKVREEYGCKRIGKRIMEKVTRCLLAEVETYDQYLTNDVYGFTFVDREGEEDSCWGFYGSNLHENGILEHIPAVYRNFVEKR